MITYYPALTRGDYEDAKILFIEYAGSIGISLEFQHFDTELAGLKKMYSLPNGGIILAKNEEEILGCVAIRNIDDATGELKRMFIKPAYQNKGLGKVLLQKALQLAKECNYRVVKLDTLHHMFAAIRLYKQAGFYETEPYYYNPFETAVYFEKIL